MRKRAILIAEYEDEEEFNDFFFSQSSPKVNLWGISKEAEASHHQNIDEVITMSLPSQEREVL
jgi:hypothetical protein